MPQRLQLRRVRGFDLQAVSRTVNSLPARGCGRPSLFANPWRVEPQVGFSRPVVVALYRRWITGRRSDTDVGSHLAELRHRVLSALPELAAHNLGCWCAEPPCHVEILLALANPQLCAMPGDGR